MDDYTNLEVQASPPNPSTGIARFYPKNVDTLQESLFMKSSKGGTVREYDLVNTLRGPSAKKTGFWNGTSTTGGDGLFCSNISTAVGTHVAVIDNTEGSHYTIATTATIDNIASWKTANNTTQRAFNPRLRFRFALAQAQPDTRIFCGLTLSPGTARSGQDPLNAWPGFALFLRTGDTTWHIASNDASGATVITEYLRNAASVATDTNWHTCEIAADATNNKIGLSLDGDPFHYITASADIPAGTTLVGPQIIIQTAVASIKTLKLAWIELESDK